MPRSVKYKSFLLRQRPGSVRNPAVEDYWLTRKPW